MTDLRAKLTVTSLGLDRPSFQHSLMALSTHSGSAETGFGSWIYARYPDPTASTSPAEQIGRALYTSSATAPPDFFRDFEVSVSGLTQDLRNLKLCHGWLPSPQTTAANGNPASMDGFTLRNPQEVLAFLQQAPGAKTSLPQLRKQIERYFGAVVHPRLEVVRFPDSVRSHLYAFIPTNLSAAEAYKRMSDLDHGWWLRAMTEADADMTITVEYTQ